MLEEEFKWYISGANDNVNRAVGILLPQIIT
jgi:hypothetical protein